MRYSLLVLHLVLNTGFMEKTDSSKFYNTTSPSGNTYDISALISETVKELKNKMNMSQKVDANTTLTNITSQPKAVRYNHILSGLNVSGLSNTLVKNSLLENIRGEEDVKLLLK